MPGYPITSAQDGTNVPSDDGVYLQAGASLSLVGGDTISAELQRKYGDSWVKVPDKNSYSDLTEAATIVLDVPGIYRIAVTTATGTWYLELTGQQ